MAATAPSPGLPRSAKTLGIPLAGVLLILFFIYLGFPYDRLAEFISAELGREAGIRVAIQKVEPHLQLAGPGFQATGVDARWENGQELQLDRALLRPAWSLSWFRGSPALHLELAGPAGEAVGRLTLNGAGAWKGELRGADLSALPLSALWPGADLEGSIEASMDLRLEEEGPVGTVVFEARDGSLATADLPMALPFERIQGDLAFGGEAFATIQSLRLEGPLLTAEVTGAVGKAPQFSAAPLALTVRLDVNPSIQSLFQSAGVRVARDGSSRLRISGTPARPLVR